MLHAREKGARAMATAAQMVVIEEGGRMHPSACGGRPGTRRHSNEVYIPKPIEDVNNHTFLAEDTADIRLLSAL